MGAILILIGGFFIAMAVRAYRGSQLRGWAPTKCQHIETQVVVTELMGRNGSKIQGFEVMSDFSYRADATRVFCRTTAHNWRSVWFPEIEDAQTLAEYLQREGLCYVSNKDHRQAVLVLGLGPSREHWLAVSLGGLILVIIGVFFAFVVD